MFGREKYNKYNEKAIYSFLSPILDEGTCLNIK